MEMQEKKLKRFNVYRIITKVLFILTLIGLALFTIISVLVLILLAVKGTDVISTIQGFIENQGFDYVLPLSSIPFYVVILVEVSTLFAISLTAYILRTLTKIFSNIVDAKTPFVNDNNKKVKNIGISLLAYAGVQLVISSLMRIELSRIFSTPGILSDGLSVNWATIGFGILVLALAEIFEFGSSLQQDNQSIV